MKKGMFEKPSLLTRVAIGKAIGFSFGLIGFITLPMFMPSVDLMFRWGVLLWYTTFGAIIGVYGVFTYHPILKLPMPWWVRAPIVGGWLNFVLTFFAYGKMKLLLLSMFGSRCQTITSPFWFVLEGVLAGLLIGYLATRFGGEGKETL